MYSNLYFSTKLSPEAPRARYQARGLARWFRLSILVGAAFLALAIQCSLYAQTLPSGFVESRIAYPIISPTVMALATDGRIFICQQGGQLLVVKNGALLTTPFLTLDVYSSGERGLVGIAVDPNFSANQYIYVYYVAKTPTVHARVSRFTANGDVAIPGSEVILIELNDTPGSVHIGGALHFGLDGKLYIAVGDNFDSTSAQSLANFRGKILRINTDGSIPTDNPFNSNAVGNNRAIWALGLRNPFTFAIQSGTGRIFINDVGESSWEEINDGFAGANYGWPTCEGVCSPPNPSFTDPIYAYKHSIGDPKGCAITGGDFYDPVTTQFPSQYTSKYFFLDYCSAWIEMLD